MRNFLNVIFIVLLTSCSHKEPLYNTQSYVFGTLVDITIYGESESRAQSLSNQIIHNFQTLHNQLHAWQPSKIKVLNQAFAQGKKVDIDPEISAIIHNATELSSRSKGTFNPAIGKLIKLWGFQQDEFKPQKIDEEKIKQLVVTNPKMSDIVISENKVFSTNPSVQLDLGGYAKGYALDNALDYLQKQKVKNALINIGGNIIALGQHGEKPWRVGIQHPRKPNAIASLDLPSGWAIGTSGDYQRYFELEGKRYCHIINPSTGYPVQGIQSVTVLIPRQKDAGTLSDVVSKPIFIALPEHRATVAKTMNVDEFLIIESEDKVFISASLAKRLIWLDADAEKHVTIITP